MTPALRIGLLALVAAANPHQAIESLASGTYLLRHATVISAERSGPLPDAAVVIADGRLAWIGSETELPAEWASSPAIDVTGRFLVPGFLDTHVHLSHPAFFSEAHEESRPALVDAYFAQIPRSYLFFGFTSVIDLDLAQRNRPRFTSARPRPRLFDGGRGIRTLGGYGPSLVPETQRESIFPVWTFEPDQLDDLPASVDPEAHRPEALIANAAKAGARLIKTYHEPGFGGAFDWPVPSADLLASLTRSAHLHGLPLVLHATGLSSYRAGIEAKVDVFAHGLWHWPGDRLVSEPPAEVLQTIRAVAQQGIGIQPTARVILGEADTWSWSLLKHPRFADATPPEVLTWLGTDEGRWSQGELIALYERLLPDPEREPSDYLEAMNERVRKMLTLYHDSKVRLVFGTDTPASEGVGNPPGLNGLLEIHAWAEAGIPPAEILRALTHSGAAAFGLLDELGTLEAGKRADLLVLGANPVETVEAFDSIELVITDGVMYERNALSARR